MKTIWKYSISIKQEIVIFSMPRNGIVINVDSQEPNIINFWVELDPEFERERRKFIVYGTGHPIDEKVKHLGTVLDGVYVWHLYEVME